MFPVIDSMEVEAFRERIVVFDPYGAWKQRDLEEYVGSFGVVERVRVEPFGFGKRRGFIVTATPYLPKAARTTLEREPVPTSRPDRPIRRGRHRLDGPAIKPRRTARLVKIKAAAQHTSNRLVVQR